MPRAGSVPRTVCNSARQKTPHRGMSPRLTRLVSSKRHLAFPEHSPPYEGNLGSPTRN